jgi:hypothetical protein
MLSSFCILVLGRIGHIISSDTCIYISLMPRHAADASVIVLSCVAYVLALFLLGWL